MLAQLCSEDQTNLRIGIILKMPKINCFLFETGYLNQDFKSWMLKNYSLRLNFEEKIIPFSKQTCEPEVRLLL